MNSLNGGYAMIKYNSTQEELAVAYKTKRPILLYDEEHRAHWVVVEEKATESVDEETEETIITYEYSYQLLNDIEALVDNSDNPRFIEGNGTPADITGFTATYCKWSLSGTHLMIVLAGTLAKGTAITSGTNIASFDIPSFISDKIYPVFSNVIEAKGATLYASDWSSQGLQIKERKVDQEIRFETGDLTLTANRNFRIQFDLLIDNE